MMFANPFDDYSTSRTSKEPDKVSRYAEDVVQLARERLRAAEEAIAETVDPGVALKLANEIGLLKEIIG